jgi:hypothetical protein
MGFIEVKNKKGTAGNTPPAAYDSWIAFWEDKKGKTATDCEVLGCTNTHELGAHLYKVNSTSKEYIAPLCKPCNNKPDGEIFKVWEGDLIPVVD